jgi:hypothetical protein
MPNLIFFVNQSYEETPDIDIVILAVTPVAPIIKSACVTPSI